MTREEAIKILSSESYIGNSKLDDAIEYAIEALSEPTTITENMTNGIEEGIRCAMCTNPMKSDSGCNGCCVVNRTMYKKVLDVIKKTLYESNFIMPKAKWISVDERLPENFQRVLVTIMTYDGYKVVRVAEYNVRQRIFRVLENHDLWEVGEKGLLAWRPLPEPYKAESEE